MISKEETLNPTDLSSIETPIEDKLKYTKNIFNQSTKQLLSFVLTTDESLKIINQNIISTNLN